MWTTKLNTVSQKIGIGKNGKNDRMIKPHQKFVRMSIV